MKNIITTLLIILWLGQVQVDAASGVRPNVLFIAVDDLNDYISPLDNHTGVKTPNFDRLAQAVGELRQRTLCGTGMSSLEGGGDDRGASRAFGDLPEHVRCAWAPLEG